MGILKFSFPKSVYGSASVKTSLSVAQSSKCCFCEGVFDAHYRGDVEHYRPKSSVTVDRMRMFPGYYWLAFTFENLFYACADCNQYRKRDLFPLVNETHRAKSHHSLIDNENPLILCPAGPRNPREHIRFFREVPVGVTEAGRRTIQSLYLDRDALNRRRLRLIRRLEADLRTIALWEGDARPKALEHVRLARKALDEAILPSSEFSAVAQDFLIGWMPP